MEQFSLHLTIIHKSNENMFFLIKENYYVSKIETKSKYKLNLGQSLSLDTYRSLQALSVFFFTLLISCQIYAAREAMPILVYTRTTPSLLSLSLSISLFVLDTSFGYSLLCTRSLTPFHSNLFRETYRERAQNYFDLCFMQPIIIRSNMV